MEILVIDKEPLAGQLIQARLEEMGHNVDVEPSKKAALIKIKEWDFDCILLDPAPLVEAKPVVFNIWKNVGSGAMPYIFLLSKNATQSEAIEAGCNDVLLKPLDVDTLKEKLENAQRHIDICRQLDDGRDVQASHDIMGKLSFNKVFLSTNDRAFRYGEESFLVLITLENYAETLKNQGRGKALSMLDGLVTEISYMCRKCDLVGRVDIEKFAILLQRPKYETEPTDALARFTKILDVLAKAPGSQAPTPHISIKVIRTPIGSLHAESSVPVRHTAETLTI